MDSSIGCFIEHKVTVVYSLPDGKDATGHTKDKAYLHLNVRCYIFHPRLLTIFFVNDPSEFVTPLNIGVSIIATPL